jgi:uncharacterized protein YdeI (YjbR/CyaY-like superfamily)
LMFKSLVFGFRQYKALIFLISSKSSDLSHALSQLSVSSILCDTMSIKT